jgi:hypothetical protein
MELYIILNGYMEKINYIEKISRVIDKYNEIFKIRLREIFNYSLFSHYVAIFTF